MSIVLNNKKIPVLDFHVHAFPDKVAERALSRVEKVSGVKPCTDGTVKNTKELFKKSNIDYFLNLNIATSPTQENTINNNVIKLNSENKNMISFGSVHHLSNLAISQLEFLKSNGVKGIKFHPDYQDFMIDDERLFPIYEKCSELGLIVVFHSGWDSLSPNLIHAPAKLSLKVHKMFPNMKLVLAHFGGLMRWNETEQYLIGEDIYFDTGMCASHMKKSQIERMILNHNHEKILFGSDCPWENPKESLEFILSLNIPDDTKEKILYKNAFSLLNIE